MTTQFQNPWNNIMQGGFGGFAPTPNYVQTNLANPLQNPLSAGLQQWNQNNNMANRMNLAAAMNPAMASAGASAAASQNNLVGTQYGWNTQANMNRENNLFGRRNLQDELATLMERAKLTSGDTRYTADRSLDEAKEAGGASRYGSLANLLGVRYGADAQRDIASQQNQFGRANLLDQLGLQRYLGDIGANTERYGFDTGFNVAREQAGADRFGSLADALLGKYRADTDLSGLQYATDAELKGLGIQGDTARDVAEIQSQTSLLPALLGLGLGQQRFNSIFPLIQGLIPQIGGMASMGIPPQFSAN